MGVSWFDDAIRLLRATESAGRAAERAIEAARRRAAAEACASSAATAATRRVPVRGPSGRCDVVLPPGVARRLARLARALSEQSGQTVTPSGALDLLLSMAERSAGIGPERQRPL